MSLISFYKRHSGFTPTSIPYCALWLDAADRSSVITSGSNVTAWYDKSGNGRNATPYQSPTVTTVNNLQAIALGTTKNFDGSITNGTANVTVFAVATTPALGASYQRLVSLATLNTTTDAFTNGFTVALEQPNLTTAMGSERNTGSIYSTGAGSISANVAFIASTEYTATTIQMFINGTRRVNASFANKGNFTYANYAIGRAIQAPNPGTNPTFVWPGNVCEVLVYNNTLTVPDRQLIEGYLAIKWSLRNSLPNGHPFKTFPLYTRVFQPTDVDGCNLWLDSADARSLTLSGSNVTQWNDKSGNANHASGGVSPTYTTNAVVFNGTTHYLTSPYSASLTTETFFMVGTNTGSTATNIAHTITGASVDGGKHLFTYGTALNVNSQNVAAGPSGGTVATNQIMMYQYNRTSGNIVTLLLNGTSVASASLGAYLAGTTTWIGRWPGTTTDNWQGSMHEIIGFNKTLSISENQLVEGYLSTKWGITLPVGHSYKLYPSLTAGFNPLQIATCTFWIDAADLTTITQSAGAVSQWNDKSGNANNLTQSTAASQPTYATNTITFASNRYLNVPQTAINNAATYSLFFVFQPISSFNWIIVKQFNGNNTNHIVSMTNSTNASGNNTAFTTGFLYYRPYNAGTQTNSGLALTLSTTCIYNITFNGTSMIHYRNGTRLSSTTTAAGAIPNLTTATNCTLGVWITTALQNSNATNFVLSEMIFHNGTVNQAQRYQMEGYLAWKWGLNTSLPTTHPFYKFAP